jgi:hypothetical protein
MVPASGRQSPSSRSDLRRRRGRHTLPATGRGGVCSDAQRGNDSPTSRRRRPGRGARRAPGLRDPRVERPGGRRGTRGLRGGQRPARHPGARDGRGAVPRRAGDRTGRGADRPAREAASPGRGVPPGHRREAGGRARPVGDRPARAARDEHRRSDRPGRIGDRGVLLRERARRARGGARMGRDPLPPGRMEGAPLAARRARRVRPRLPRRPQPARRDRRARTRDRDRRGGQPRAGSAAGEGRPAPACTDRVWSSSAIRRARPVPPRASRTRSRNRRSS